jgi:hypothetical protein
MKDPNLKLKKPPKPTKADLIKKEYDQANNHWIEIDLFLDLYRYSKKLETRIDELITLTKKP